MVPVYIDYIMHLTLPQISNQTKLFAIAQQNYFEVKVLTEYFPMYIFEGIFLKLFDHFAWMLLLPLLLLATHHYSYIHICIQFCFVCYNISI